MSGVKKLAITDKIDVHAPQFLPDISEPSSIHRTYRAADNYFVWRGIR
jgi:hypothetical protein